jgi:MFS transporter, FSR family, fosmidomycin resistance protein
MPNLLETHWIDAASRAIVRALPGIDVMTEATERLHASRSGRVRVVGAVSAAHFVSHYYIIVLAPLLPFVRADYGVSYTEIGVALAVFNTVTAALQAPAGFLVDRLGARLPLIGGLLLGAFAFVVVAIVDSYWVFVAMFAIAGIGNAVYHPADYAWLSQDVPASRIGPAFSFHTFAGMAGSAAAPPTLLLLQSVWGWRGAFIGAAILGLAVAATLIAIRNPTGAPVAASRRSKANESAADWWLLTSPAILLNLLFFMLLAMISGGIYNYSVVALGVLYAAPVTAANAALTAFLVLSSIGVLVGGLLVTRTDRHALVASLGLSATALFTALIAEIDFGSLMLIGAMMAAGFFSGVIMPSRDMIVREITPPGSFGKVFGFVTTGFNLGGIVSPLIFGAIMDRGSPRWVFLCVAACSLLAIVTVATRPRAPA